MCYRAICLDLQVRHEKLFFMCEIDVFCLQYMRVGRYNKGEMQIFTLHKLKNNFLKITESIYGFHQYAMKQVDH